MIASTSAGWPSSGSTGQIASIRRRAAKARRSSQAPARCARLRGSAAPAPRRKRCRSAPTWLPEVPRSPHNRMIATAAVIPTAANGSAPRGASITESVTPSKVDAASPATIGTARARIAGDLSDGLRQAGTCCTRTGNLTYASYAERKYHIRIVCQPTAAPALNRRLRRPNESWPWPGRSSPTQGVAAGVA